jgi:hypothetical protein
MTDHWRVAELPGRTNCERAHELIKVTPEIQSGKQHTLTFPIGSHMMDRQPDIEHHKEGNPYGI